ncbi:low affinity iron permease family protein [Lysobacter koreensis]|uniref:Low affinity iron permease family protein n=1 Tax=Lysobacter koreensis TaxID=266122 RepID=A0ABW2YHJ4_9GAMM
MNISTTFNKLAKAAARTTGRPLAFTLASFVILAWLVSGPVFQFSDTWQLVINTGTTVVTFLMVFLIQNTQSRDTEAMQIKLDELIRVTDRASNALLDLEELDELTLDRYRAHYEALARHTRTQAHVPGSGSESTAAETAREWTR